MATSAPTWSRPHRPGADTAQLTGIYRQITHEWSRMSDLPHIQSTLTKWGRKYPVLRGTDGLADLLDRIDAAKAEETDKLLGALVCLAQAGQQLAGQVVLQAMLPKLSKMARTTNMSTTDAESLEERRHIGIATFLDVLSRYPLERRPKSVAAGLYLDTLHVLTAGNRTGAQEIPASFSEYGLRRDVVVEMYGEVLDRPCEEGIQVQAPVTGLDPTESQVSHRIGHSPNPDGDLLEVVAWGLDRQAITSEDASYLVQVYAPALGEEGGHIAVATKLGMKPEFLRQRCSRATRALAAAVRAHAEGSWSDSPAAIAS